MRRVSGPARQALDDAVRPAAGQLLTTRGEVLEIGRAGDDEDAGRHRERQRVVPSPPLQLERERVGCQRGVLDTSPATWLTSPA